jgi:hypothetical protein
MRQDLHEQDRLFGVGGVGRAVARVILLGLLAGCARDPHAPTGADPLPQRRYQSTSQLERQAESRVLLDGAGTSEGVADEEIGAARLNAVANGLFEAGLRGWTVVDQPGGSGSWFSQLGAGAPFSGLPHPAPVDPPQALSDQLGAGSHILYQDVTVPAHGGRLTFDLSVDNWAGEYFTPPTLDFTVVPNQQFRADIISPSDPLDTVRILSRVFATTVGMPSVFSTRVSFNMAPFAGQTVRLRFAEVDNQLFLNVGIDNVRIR